MARNRRPGKGSYGEVRLPVAREYVRTPSRNRFVLLGGAALAAVLAIAAWDFFRRDAGVISNGPLSSAHAGLEADCSSCHASFAAVTDQACETCHERRGAEPAAGGAAEAEPAIYSLAAHYRDAEESGRRREPTPAEVACAACHLEHRGRGAEIARAADSRCLGCHDFGSFSRRHPEFAFAAEGIADSDALTFPHSHHVNELMRRRSLTDVEPACLACHESRPGSGGFRPLDFDRHCAACHLTAAERTPPLPVAGADGSAPGVETLETVRRRGGPGSRWADEVSSAEFLNFGSRVVKTPLHHRDPWVLHNLRRLRRRLYPDAGLADLLTATADARPDRAAALYREAIASLERQARDLRARPEPELQRELARIEPLLAELRRRVEAPGARLDESGFRLAAAPRADLDPEAAEAIEALAADLTQPCRRCHVVRDATIVRVQTDQRTLTRAEFDHRPHLLQRRCLDCHAAIPIADYLGQEQPAPAEVDHAAIQDLPRIATCRECHNPRQASERCVTCHLFHPDPGDRLARLLAEGAAGGAREAADGG